MLPLAAQETSHMNQLDQLRKFTTVVADTGDFESMREHKPTDATTNPSLILKALSKDAYRPILQDTLARYPEATPADILDHILVEFGRRILEIVPGRVSTEVDARLSFDTEGTVARAHRIIELYDQAGVDRKRVLIKIASTWEGIAAARILQNEGIACNMTLLFSLIQAVVCADAGVTLISPFVGRIYDWHKKAAGSSWVEADNSGTNDPGVQSVTRIYQYYRRHGIETEIMGASFRNVGQVLALAGCDLLTISPELLGELAATEGSVTAHLHESMAAKANIDSIAPEEKNFRFLLNEDAMATEKLSEGIRTFVADAIKLDTLIEASRKKG